MSPDIIFSIHLVLGYVACLLCFRVYFWPKLKSMDSFEAQRVIATIHSFRFFGLVFILPGVVGPDLPASFATFAAYGDFATGVLALMALMATRVRPLFWTLAVAFNAVGIADLLVAYYHAVRAGLPATAGQLGSTYMIPIIYVPALMITHIAAFYLLLHSQPGGDCWQRGRILGRDHPHRLLITRRSLKVRCGSRAFRHPKTDRFNSAAVQAAC